MKLKSKLLAIALASLASCTPSIRSGIITKMWHEPERVYEKDNSTEIEINDIKIPIIDFDTMLDDEDWIIQFEGKTEDGYAQKRTIYATERFYNEFGIGDNIDLGHYVEKPIPFEDNDYDVRID